MPSKKNRVAIQAPLSLLRQASRGGGGAWHHLPAIAKRTFIMALMMALLGFEIELRLRPQVDVLLTAGGVLSLWVWLGGDG